MNKYITSSCCSVFVQHLSFQDYIQFQILKRGLIVSHPFVSYTKLMTTARQSGSEIRLVVSTFIILIQFQTFLPFDGLVEHCVCFLNCSFETNRMVRCCWCTSYDMLDTKFTTDWLNSTYKLKKSIKTENYLLKLLFAIMLKIIMYTLLLLFTTKNYLNGGIFQRSPIWKSQRYRLKRIKITNA